MSLFIFLFFLLCALGYVFTKGLILYAHKKQLLDVANHRSSHVNATPRIGGLSFVVLISVLGCTYALLHEMSNLILFTIVPTMLVALTGLVDDIKGISRTKRFAIYFICALIALGNLSAHGSNSYWEIVLTGFFLALGLSWLINLFNFMDGIDGIAASESIFVLSGLALLTYCQGFTSFSYFLILCTAPITGFLILNWQPAKIFMGDIGSTFLGCVIGCICLYAINLNAVTLYSVIILLGLFIVDASWTLAYRIATGQKWYLAHRSHNYQILSRKYNSHQQVSLLYSAINLFWLLPLAIAANYWREYALLITTISVLPLIWLCFIMGAGKIEKN